ncbi:MAG: hypothetical protein JXA16_09415 [Bacteroidales bacterium]|nr:hypothetical protein [Bacteroidales bacterium]
MKIKINSILLFLILFVPFIATYSWLSHKKKLIKKEVKNLIVSNIDKNQLTVFKFQINEIESKLKWKHSKEFEYNGQMFDIVESKIINDSITYLCWPDNEETVLNKKLQALLNLALGKNPLTNKNKSRLINFYNTLYFNNIEKINFVNEKNHNLISYYYNNYKSIYLSPQNPPPQF